jgi:hypothetical protein
MNVTQSPGFLSWTGDSDIMPYLVSIDTEIRANTGSTPKIFRSLQMVLLFAAAMRIAHVWRDRFSSV